MRSHGYQLQNAFDPSSYRDLYDIDLSNFVKELPMQSVPQYVSTNMRNAHDPASYWYLYDHKRSFNLEYEGDSTTLMILDTGIDRTHPSFAQKGDKLWEPQGDCSDDKGHGTVHVLGVQQ